MKKKNQIRIGRGENEKKEKEKGRKGNGGQVKKLRRRIEVIFKLSSLVGRGVYA